MFGVLTFDIAKALKRSALAIALLFSLIAIALLLSLIATASAHASSGPLHLQLIGQAGQITEPTSLVSDPSDPNRLYFTQRYGFIYALEKGQLSLLVDLSSLIAPVGEEEIGGEEVKNGEESLNSMVLAPDFAQTGHFYVDFPSKGAGNENIQVDELTAGGNPAAVLASLRKVIEIPHPETHHHFGGDLQFGPEGDLYISTGDSYPPENYPDESPAQELTSLLGKILRIDPHQSGGQPYTVPPDNPFVGMPPDKPEIWSYGLRNPFRFSIDDQTGDMFIGDVGQDTAEEIDYAPGGPGGAVGGAGADYGWPCMEGSETYLPTPEPGCPPSPPTFTAPIFTYPHPDPAAPDCAAVIGGYLVRDPTLGDLNGRYVYGDYCSGAISSLEPHLPEAANNRSETALTDGLGAEEEERFFQLESFGQDACGRVYLLTAYIYRIEGESPASCVPKVDQERERGVTAVLEQSTTAPPSNAFSLVKFKTYKHGGRKLLVANVPGPGTIVLSAKGVARVSKQVQEGNVSLAIAPKGKKKEVLTQTGQAKVRVKVTFTPAGGNPYTRYKTVKLTKKR